MTTLSLGPQQDLKPFTDDLVLRTDKRIGERLAQVGIGTQNVDGDYVAGLLKLKPITLLVSGAPDPIPDNTVLFHSTTYPARVRAWELIGAEASTLSMQIDVCALANYPALTWTPLGAASLGGRAWNRDPALAGWTKDPRGWVLIPRDTRWRITIPSAGSSKTVLLLIDLDYCPDADAVVTG